MNVYQARDFTGGRAWQALDVARIEGATIRLHWTDQPYIWHVNDGPEVFVVLDGEVTMKVRGADGERAFLLTPGSIFHAEAGDEHVAHPVGEARILVIEKAGSL